MATWVNEIHVEPICKLGDSRGNLVEVNALLPSIALDDEHRRRMYGKRVEERRYSSVASGSEVVESGLSDCRPALVAKGRSPKVN